MKFRELRDLPKVTEWCHAMARSGVNSDSRTQASWGPGFVCRALDCSPEKSHRANPAENIRKALGWFGLLVEEKPYKIICEGLNGMRRWWGINSFPKIQ